MRGILLSTENAFETYIKSVLGAQEIACGVYTGFDDETYNCPKVICYAESGEEIEDGLGLGVYRVRLNISVKENVSETIITTSTLSDFVFRAIVEASIATISQQITGYVIHDMIMDGGINNIIEENLYTQTLTLGVVCSLTE